ncbi:hypothetical protein Taro_030678, partial [Colocasia esculenta]|nr:hypothetical protein [Colocasia esculenta]
LLSSSRFFSGTLLPSSPLSLRPKCCSVAILGDPRAAAPPPAPLPSLRPSTRRRNHLRRKLLETLTSLPPHPVPQAPQAPVGGGEGSHSPVEEVVPEGLQLPLLPLSHEDPADGYALVVEERESALLLRQEVLESSSPFPEAPIQRDVPRLLLELSVYLVGLLAVQTVCAVWLFGGVIVEEGKSAKTAANATVGEVKGAGPEVWEREVEFERTVAVIQAMAREARATEAREAGKKDEVSALRGDIMGEVNRRLGRLAKRTPRVYLDAKALSDKLVKGNDGKVGRAPAKGFNGSRSSAASTRDLKNGAYLAHERLQIILSINAFILGGSQQIDRDGHFKKPPKVHARSQSSTSEMVADGSRDPLVSDLKNSHSSGDLSTSDQGIFGKSRDDLTIGTDRTWKDPVSLELDEHSSPFDEVMHQKQTHRSKKASGVSSKIKKAGTPDSQHSLGEKHVSASIHRHSHTTTEIVSGKKTKNKNLRKKKEDSQFDALNQLWWLKLPYVLAIFLHRGSNRKEFKGLYSLKLDSSSEESHSYTVAFEDRADATNFCYLLESFFEDLDDFSADIVPLSIQEVHDAVKSGTLKVIVVGKGQLQLYAGQPLAEAEVQLLSMLE